MFLDACGTDEEAYRISIVEFMKAGKVWPIVLLLRHIEGNYVQLTVMVVVLHLSLLFCVFLSTAISAIAPTVQYSSFSLNISFLLHSTIPFYCNKQSDLGSSDYNFDISFSSVRSSSEYYHLYNKCNIIMYSSFFLYSFEYF